MRRLAPVWGARGCKSATRWPRIAHVNPCQSMCGSRHLQSLLLFQGTWAATKDLQAALKLAPDSAVALGALEKAKELLASSKVWQTSW